MGCLISFFKKYTLLCVLFCLITFVFLWGEQVPLQAKNVLYTISLHIKSFLLFMLPFLVLPYIVTSIFEMKGRGVILLLALIVLVALSNFTAIMVGYGVGQTLIPHLHLSEQMMLNSTNEVCHLVNYFVEPLVSIELVLVAGLIIGLVLAYAHLDKVEGFFLGYRKAATFFFQRIFTPILPLYILGLLLKLQHDSDCGSIFLIFRNLAFLIIATQLCYLFLVFLAGAGWHPRRALQAIKNALPAGAVGVSTISSVVTMPVTLEAAEKNTTDNNLARLTIASTVNAHAIGECISLPMIAVTIYFMTFHHMPDLSTYLPFALVLTWAQFGAVSVAGGSVIIMLNGLTTNLGFTAEMIGLIIAISIFTDPWGTGCNIMGNSGFVMIVEKLNNFFKRKRA